MATDPVCGMAVDERTAELRLVRDNRTYYFCATSCLEEFSAPERQLARLRQRLVVAWPLALIVAFLTYRAPFPDWPWAALGLATVVQFYAGLPFYRGTYDAARSRIWNMDVLIAVGTTVAFGYSAAALLLPGRLPATYYFDASALIITLILSGNYLEHRTREHARGALRRLRELSPPTARVLREGREVELPVSEVRPGDRLRIVPGARFPADGRILEGRSTVVEALLTGESDPLEKSPGDAVLAGTVNGEGGLVVEATGVGEDTRLAQIARLVAEAETSRVPLQRLADRIASIFVPVVLGLAILAALFWFALGAGTTIALLVFVAVAITACPCAFGLATPAAIVVGTGRAAEEGILFKGRDSLERASRIDLVLMDKTGTLTLGRPELVRIVPAAGWRAEKLLGLAAGLEAGSEHPLARAVRDRAAREGVVPEPVRDIVAAPGRGVSGRTALERIEIVRGSALGPSEGGAGELAPAAREMASTGETVSALFVDGRAAGLLGFSDPIAPGAAESVRELSAEGVRTVMVTGDHAGAAARVARAVGITEVHADVRPEGKLELLRRYQAEGRHVAFVGDGLNDAPVLAASDLGIAIGAGTDVAQEAGGVVLLRPDLRGVPGALRVGRRTVGKVRGNLTWALGYNAVLLPIAAGALVPVFGLGIFQVLPLLGAAAMGLSSTSVMVNSLTLRWRLFHSAPREPPGRGPLVRALPE
jgi:Cu+-exporting ATPase